MMPPPAQLLLAIAGLLLGYATVSLAESFLHRNMQHASRKLRDLCQRLGSAGKAVIRAHLSHTVVHHGRTYKKSHVQQFRSPEERVELDRWLVDRHAGERIIQEKYGLSLADTGVLWFIAPVLPLFALYTWLLPLPMTIGTLVFLVIYPCSSMFLHPYLHMTKEEAMRAASPSMRWLLGTRYVQFISRHHYLHHRYIHCNYNLLWLGDFVLGHHRRASQQDLDLMKEIGMIC
jgi:hypothetical protein